MKAYTVLIKTSNSLMAIANEDFANLIKAHNGGVALSGYDPIKYITCVCFAYESERDGFAAELDERGIDYKKRDDAIIPDGFL